MRQLVIFASEALVAFARAYLCFLVSASSKKNAEVIKFLGILKKYVSKNNIFVQERKAMFHLIKKLFLSFTQFSNLIS